MSRRVRRLIILGLAAGGVLVVRRALATRAARKAVRGTWPSDRVSGPAAVQARPPLTALPAAPVISDMDAIGLAVEPEPVTAHAGPYPPEPEPLPEPEPEPALEPPPGPLPASPAPAPPAERGRVDTANLDKVRQRLASIQVDAPPGLAPPGPEGGSRFRSRRTKQTEPWRAPNEDGTCPPDFPVKVKLRSRLFHLPGMFAYERTRADRCYRASTDAEDDGFVRAKR